MMFRINVPIHLRKRIETLETRVALVGWQTLDGGANEPIFKRLHEPQFVCLQWTTDCQPRSERFDSHPFVTTPTKSREEVLCFNIKFVRTGTRCDGSYTAGKFAVLRRVGVREHLDRFNCFDR